MNSAISNNIIYKACFINKPFYDDDEGNVEINDLGFFVYEIMVGGKTPTVFPYYKTHSPKFPLKTPNLIDKIPYFENISFEKQEFIQPIDYMECNTWFKNIEKEEVKILSSYDINEYHIIPPILQVFNKMGLHKCKKCYPDGYYYLDYDCHIFKEQQDYQPVILIKESFLAYHREGSELFLYHICDALNISIDVCYISFCVKCYDRMEMKKNKKEDLLQTEKFEHCFQHFNTEIAGLQPLFLIAIGNTVFKMLQSQYEISGFSKIPCLCIINIEEKQYPLLVANNAKTEKEKAILKKFQMEKSDEIKAILAKQ